MAIHKAIQIAESCDSAGLPDGRYVPARPYSMDGFGSRLKQAWGVLTGKYDALDWEQDPPKAY